MTVRFDGKVNALSNGFSPGADSLFAQAGLNEGLSAVIEHIAKGGKPEEALGVGLNVVKASPFGQSSLQNLKFATQVLDTFVKHPEVARHWSKVGTWVAKPENQQVVLEGLSKLVGSEAGKILGEFGNRIVKNLTKESGGFEYAFKFAERAAPKVAKKLGGTSGLGGLLAKLLPKVSKLVPFVGLGISLIQTVKVFTKSPPASALEKLNALVGVAAGAAAVIPGVGTGVAAALNTASTVLGGLDLASAALSGGRDNFDQKTKANPQLLNPESQPQPLPPTQFERRKGELEARVAQAQTLDDYSRLVGDYVKLLGDMRNDPTVPQEEYARLAAAAAELEVMRTAKQVEGEVLADGQVTDEELRRMSNELAHVIQQHAAALPDEREAAWAQRGQLLDQLNGLNPTERAWILQQVAQQQTQN